MIVAFYFCIRISITTAWAKFKPVQSPRLELVTSALTNLNMKHYKSVKILSNFQNVQSPCENLSPLFKTFWRRFWFLTPYLFTRQFSCIGFLPVWKSKKHANSEQVKALEGFLYRPKESADWALLSSFCDVSNLRISVFK